jgi:aryl-alcohol dehydrogenase-like predicted oxidoreductase
MVWSPLAGGLLSGKFTREGEKPEGARRASFDFPPVDRERAFACVDAMREIAAARGGGLSVAQVAIAWLLHRPVVTSVIIGAKRREQLDENLAATEVRLELAELEKLDRASALPREYPGWMIERQDADRLKPVPR